MLMLIFLNYYFIRLLFHLMLMFMINLIILIYHNSRIGVVIELPFFNFLLLLLLIHFLYRLCLFLNFLILLLLMTFNIFRSHHLFFLLLLITFSLQITFHRKLIYLVINFRCMLLGISSRESIEKRGEALLLLYAVSV